ncbi:hypothetical protein BRD17_08585 [Halobacteriales archaeon SW_7_68_16]|nr:MAG: hypothetical protein BRD17_08585 [Halobacteriales archaeon SW_7_68_16]
MAESPRNRREPARSRSCTARRGREAKARRMTGHASATSGRDRPVGLSTLPVPTNSIRVGPSIESGHMSGSSGRSEQGMGAGPSIAGFLSDPTAASSSVSVVLMVAFTLLATGVVATTTLVIAPSGGGGPQVAFDVDFTDTGPDEGDRLVIEHVGGDGFDPATVTVRIEGARATDGDGYDGTGSFGRVSMATDHRSWATNPQWVGTGTVDSGERAAVTGAVSTQAGTGGDLDGVGGDGADADGDGRVETLELDDATVRLVRSDPATDESVVLREWTGG